jgi:phosphatidylethanolamine-binding protein (PEBP) family uncharacterized protein
LAGIAAAAFLGAALTIVACSSDDVASVPAAVPTEAPVDANLSSMIQDVEMSIDVSSTAFNRIRRIPIEHACTTNKTNPNVPGGVQFGGNQSPPLVWSGIPEGTVSLALIMEGQEPRADGPNIHWLVWNIPPDATEPHASVATTSGVSSIGPRASQGTNSFGRIGYDGPCPEPINLDAQGGGPEGDQRRFSRHREPVRVPYIRA